MALPGLLLTVLAGPTVPTPLPEPVLSRLRSAKVTETDERALRVQPHPRRGAVGSAGGVRQPAAGGLAAAAGRPRRARRDAGRGPHRALRRHRHRDRAHPRRPPRQRDARRQGRGRLATCIDLEERDAEYPALTDYLQVLAVLAPYAAQGILPAAVPAPVTDPPLPTEQVPTQHDDGPRVTWPRSPGGNGYVAYVDPRAGARGEHVLLGSAGAGRAAAAARCRSTSGAQTNVGLGADVPDRRARARRMVDGRGAGPEQRAARAGAGRGRACARRWPPLPLSAVHPVRTRRLRESGRRDGDRDRPGAGRRRTAASTPWSARARSTAPATATCCARADWSACAGPAGPTTGSGTCARSCTRSRRGSYRQNSRSPARATARPSRRWSV